jgi:uncharacterized protein (TIGR01244 family)
MAYNLSPLLFGLVAPLTFWSCQTCEIISFAEAAGEPERGNISWIAANNADTSGTSGNRLDVSATALPIIPVSDQLAVTAQPSLDDLKQFAAAGYHTLISNRPSGEADDQPSPQALAAEARRLGLSFVYIPVTVDSISRSDVEAFRDALAASEGQTIAHCRSGKRAYLLWAAGEVLEQERDPAELMQAAAERGFDLKELPDILERISH